MNKLKLFPKIFLDTIGIMSTIVLLVHGLMYVMLPSFYLDQKREEIATKANELMEILKETNEERSIEIAEHYAIQHNVNITLDINGEIYQYQGFTPLDIYFDPAMQSSIVENSTIRVEEPESLSSYQVILEKKKFINKNDLPYELDIMLSSQPIDEMKQNKLLSNYYLILSQLALSSRSLRHIFTVA